MIEKKKNGGKRLRQKRVLAVHDLSCFGKCSLTVALPVLSAAGVECVCLPTAVLSTHTGGFCDYVYHDLSEEILPIVDHWRREKIDFDTVYAGYLGNVAIAEKLAQILEKLTCFTKRRETGNSGLKKWDGTREEDGLEIVSAPPELLLDPAMADGGQLYPGIKAEMVDGYRMLMERSALVMPNITEAALLCDEPYREGPHDEGWIEMVIHALQARGAREVLLTGVEPDDRQIGVAVASADGTVRFFYRQRVKGSYHGTGDLFASAVVAARTVGNSLMTSAEIAMEFTADAILRTARRGTDRRYGVDFENALPDFMEKLRLRG